MEFFEDLGTDKSQTRQISQSQSQTASVGTQDQNINKNIEDLKKLQKTNEMFYEIYETLNHITTENDFDAMNFAVKEKFHNVKSKDSRSIFEHSIEYDFLIALLLIEFGGNSNHHHDINKALIRASLIGEPKIVKLLYKYPGVDVNAKDIHGRTALIWASYYGKYEIVKFLLTVPGIDVNAKDDICNETALIWASENGSDEVIKLLLTVPEIDVNAKDNKNKTALIWASWNGHHEVVKLLLSVPGIDVNAKDSDKNTAFIYASMLGYDEIVKLLLTVPGIVVYE